MASTPLQPGAQARVAALSPTEAGSATFVVTTEADTVLVALWVGAVSGTVAVQINDLVGPAFTGGNTRRTSAVAFPTLSAPTAELVVRRAPVTTEQVEIVVTYSAACSFELWARAVYGGLSDARILGAAGMRVSQKDVTTTATLLIAAALQDRNGIVIKNWSTTGNLYVAESAAKATTSIGYPLAPRDGLAVDLAGGQEVWGVAETTTVDCRLGESGN